MLSKSSVLLLLQKLAFLCRTWRLSRIQKERKEMRFWKMASLCIYWMMCRERNRTFEGVDRPMCNGIGHKLNRVDNSPSGSKDAHTEYDKELFAVSMRSIGAFYWMDRASPSIPPGSNNRRSLSLQSVSDIAVQEIQKILVVHPMLVLTTKAASLQDKFTSRAVIRSTGQLSIESNFDSRTIRSSTNAQLYREYMPSVWQSFVSHRILVRPSDDSKYPKQPIYLSEWLLPSLKLADKFTSNDDGTYIIS